MLANRNNDAKQEFLKVEKSFQFVKSEIKNDDWRNDNIDSDIEIQMNLNKKEVVRYNNYYQLTEYVYKI